MSRHVLFLTVCAVICAADRQPCRADDDPSVAGKKASEWMTLLEKDETPRVRRAAVIALGIAGPKTPGVVSALAQALRKDKDGDVRREAAQTLRDMGDNALDGLGALLEALREDKEDAVRQTAAVALGRIAKNARSAVVPLTAALKDKHPGTRAAAAESLGQFGREANDATEDLVATLLDKSNDRFVRSFAAISLGRIGGDPDVVVPALVKVLGEDGHPELRDTLIDALGQYGGRAAEAVPLLIKYVKLPAANTRRKAVITLGRIGREGSSAVPALREILAARDSDKLLLSCTIRTLGSFGKEAREAVPDLVAKCKGDVLLEVRLAAIEELGNIGPDAKPAVDILTIAQKDGRADVREAATESLKKIQGTP